MARPRLDVDEDSIVDAYRAGTSVNALAQAHDVDRSVIRRVLTEADGGTLLQFPTKAGVVIPPGHITSTDLTAQAQISYRQLDVWTRAGLLNPTNGNEPGTGRPRFYPLHELHIARLMRELLHAGLTPRVAHDLAEQLLEHGHAYLAGIRIDLPQDL